MLYVVDRGRESLSSLLRRIDPGMTVLPALQII